VPTSASKNIFDQQNLKSSDRNCLNGRLYSQQKLFQRFQLPATSYQILVSSYQLPATSRSKYKDNQQIISQNDDTIGYEHMAIPLAQ
jgi:hypothetical protein